MNIIYNRYIHAFLGVANWCVGWGLVAGKSDNFGLINLVIAIAFFCLFTLERKS